MSVYDLRTWLDKMEEAGELAHVNGADPMFEVGCISDLTRHAYGPALLFDNFEGHEPGFRVLTGALSASKSMALTVGLEGEYSNKELVRAMAGKLEEAEKRLAEFDYEIVEDGPIFENQVFGDDVDLDILPVPTWHEMDGGPYIGTGIFQVHVDPENGHTNAGCYRVMKMNKREVGNFIGPGHHGHTIRNKYWARGEGCPTIMVMGAHPAFFMLGSTDVDEDVSEFAVVGSLMNTKVPMVRGKITGLPFPAESEIVLEGYVYPDKRQKEGPFGEFTGYYGRGETENEYYMEVEALYYRNDPILLGCPPCKPPHDFSYSQAVTRSAAVMVALKKAGVPGVQCVWDSETGGGRMWLVTSIKQCLPGHASQAACAAAFSYAGNILNKWSIVVDDDIDPTDADQVNWALCTRVNPIEDIDIIRCTTTTPLDPALRPEVKKTGVIESSRAIIRATIPYDRVIRGDFPPVVWPSEELEARVRDKFGDLGIF